MAAKKQRLETQVREKLVEELEKVPFSATKTMPVHSMSGNVGMPDVLFTCVWLRGLSVWVEVKRPGARKQDHEAKQAREQWKLERAGAVVLRRVENVGMLRRLMWEELGLKWVEGVGGAAGEAGSAGGSWVFDAKQSEAGYSASRWRVESLAAGVRGMAAAKSSRDLARELNSELVRLHESKGERFTKGGGLRA